jgi:hypothetical protein
LQANLAHLEIKSSEFGKGTKKIDFEVRVQHQSRGESEVGRNALVESDLAAQVMVENICIIFESTGLPKQKSV